METKWIAIAVAVAIASAQFALSINYSKQGDVKIACYAAQGKTTIDLKCEN